MSRANILRRMTESQAALLDVSEQYAEQLQAGTRLREMAREQTFQIDLVGVATGPAGGDTLSLHNPFGKRVIVTKAVLHHLTAGTAAGASKMNVGIGAAADTVANNIVDSGDIKTITREVDQYTLQGADAVDAAIPALIWEVSEYLNASAETDDGAGWTGSLYITVIIPD